MQFLYPALAAGFLFVAVPPLVHLINMLRHRRQSWAAMEFLLASYRKQKKWIILRQLLLLLCRIGVAATLIAMLAGWTGGSAWLDAFGGQTTHHVVILDDSYSMADSSGGNTAYSRAVAALDGLARRLRMAEGNHQLTVIRSSRAALVVRGGSESGDAAAEMSAADLRGDLRGVERVVATEPSPLADDLVAALQLAEDLSNATTANRTLLYVLSDFRARDWESPERAAEAIGAVSRLGAEIRMIDCAVAPAGNLAVTSLEPLPDVWVAGVPAVFRATVRNYGTTPARNVTLAVRTIRYGSEAPIADAAERVSGRIESLPGVVFDSLAPGAEATKEFQVFISERGVHAVEVELPDDAVRIDNRRAATLPLSDAARVLIVDGAPEQRGAYHVASVLDPGSQVRTGAVPEIRPPSYLRTASADDLAAYRAVYLIDLPQIDAAAAAALEAYVSNGGGLMWFIGNKALAERYNETLLGANRRLLPGPLSEPIPLDVSGATGAPDLALGEPHRLTEPLATIGDAALSLVRVSRSMGVELPAEPEAPTRSVLRRRDGEPVVLQHDVGRGRVITALLGLDGEWTNWTGDPTFVVFMLRANAYLWSAAAAATSGNVEDAVVLNLPADAYAPSITYLPAVAAPPRIPIEEQAEVVDDEVLRFELNPITAALEGDSDLDAMLEPGISELWLTRLNGDAEVRPYASAVRSGEGDLSRADRGDIRRDVQPAVVTFYDADEVIASEETSGNSLTALLLFCALGLLLGGEQILAYLASYHPPLSGAKS
ncbi:BatA domain-containing protein [Candidatus Laterigemmans baculatus]|uniref:BatA domain-containing protein n=1 Tax=Candidatus Laterigemmans baculatus TaxID=2770505 RepID=UPI0013DBD3FF|nr:BatA domain-containing protein [Candidatus Laterigemmans baculatus]